jgi:hypothetical protein
MRWPKLRRITVDSEQVHIQIHSQVWEQIVFRVANPLHIGIALQSSPSIPSDLISRWGGGRYLFDHQLELGRDVVWQQAREDYDG